MFMKFLNKLERKFGRYAVHNLSLYLIIGYVIGYVIELFHPDMLNYLTLDPYAVLHGQIWRLVTWVLNPPSGLSIFTIIMLLFYYSLGTNLERTWGAFRYNVYIFGGILCSIIGCFLIFGIMCIGNMDVLLFGTEAGAQVLGLWCSLYFSTYYINLSIFLAFAACYPDMQVMLYFIIPVKIKWLAWLDVAYLVYQIVIVMRAGAWPAVIAIVASLLNFLIFFFVTKDFYRISPGQIKRKASYRKKVEQATVRSYHHKCAVCGRTEKDGDLTFRYCSKCQGNYEYCQDHLFTHVHKTLGDD